MLVLNYFNIPNSKHLQWDNIKWDSLYLLAKNFKVCSMAYVMRSQHPTWKLKPEHKRNGDPT